MRDLLIYGRPKFLALPALDGLCSLLLRFSRSASVKDRYAVLAVEFCGPRPRLSVREYAERGKLTSASS